MMKNILGQALYQLTVTFGMMFFGELLNFSLLAAVDFTKLFFAKQKVAA